MKLLRLATIASVLALTAAACSEDEETGGGAASPEPTEAPAEATVMVEDSDLGQIVVDAEGRTLYVFLADETAESTCYDECEDAWPPLTVDGEPVAGDGVEGTLATSERTDGSTQVTLDGHPLYYFGSDETPDDMNGQGVGDVWYVVSPSGDAIQG